MNLFSIEGKEIMRAKADMSGDSITGTANFVEYEFGTERVVKITLGLKGDPAKLKAGAHAVHIHEKPCCDDDPSFKCAGGHFDPGPAGNSDPDVNHPYHAGDLPNIVVDESGNGVLEAITTRVTLSPGPLSILTEGGTSLMVHANTDPYQGGEHGSGISGGPRLCCGNIKQI
jgi:superoxide dismutase, Cu-Zn family